MVNAAKYIFSQSCSETAGSQSRATGTIHHEGRKGTVVASPSSIYHQSGDLLRHRVENEGEEKSEDDEDNHSDDVLFELLPDQVDEGLHGIGEPGEAGGRATRGKHKRIYIFTHHIRSDLTELDPL